MAIATFKGELFDHGFISKACSARNTDKYAIFLAKGFDVVRTLSAFKNFDDDSCLSAEILQCDIGNNCRFTTIGYGICNGIHHSKNIFLWKANELFSVIDNAKNDFTAATIGKCDH